MSGTLNHREDQVTPPPDWSQIFVNAGIVIS